MRERRDVPAWLLDHLYLKTGIFNDDETAVTSALDDPRAFSIDLTKRPDWQTIQKATDR